MNGLRHIVLLLGMGIFFAQDPPDEFQYNSSMQMAFYYFNSVTINGIAVEPEDWVGAFRDTNGDGEGDICVGSRRWDTTGFCSDDQYSDEQSCMGASESWTWNLCSSICDVPIMGADGNEFTDDYMQNGDIPIFKIYDASENEFYDAIASEDIGWGNFNFNNIESLTASPSSLGCTDDTACNYDPVATEDDGSCEYAQENYDCAGNCTAGEDCNGECGGSTELDECGVCGGSGITEGTCDCDGNVLDECGVCGGDNSTCSGCIDSLATNFDPDALVSDGSCEYPVYGCLDETALNYNPEATNSNGNCDYLPEVGIWFGNIDADAGSMEIYVSSDSDLDNISFSISGAAINDASGGAAESNGLIVSIEGNTITASGSLNDGSGLLTELSFSDGGSEFCITQGSASSPGYESVNITLGGCSVLVGLDGGVVESETGGVDIPEGALSESENIAVGDVTEELPEEVDNATGFEVEELVAFTPFDLVFEVPVEISVSGSSQSRDEESLCYLEDATDTEWEVVEGADCTDGTCTADVTEFGIFATCILVEDCNGDLGGFAYLDDCGECVGGNTGNAANYTMDECGLCDGPGYIEWYIDADGDNLGYGDGVLFCSDVVPDGYVPNNNDPAGEENCATNDSDECGLCGGEGPDTGYNCDGNCIVGFDCEGICGGNAVEDECGVCGGTDIDGNGICDIVCEGIIDCAGICDGTAEEDECGVCNGNNTCAGCDGVANSGMVLDECGECGGYGIEEGACDCEGNVADCLGVCGGSSELDECGVCNGPGPSTWYGDSDGDGLGNPDDVQMSCDSPEDYVPNDDDEYPECGANYYDCADECGGSAVIDECGDCGGGNSACADECGVPYGDNTSCADECGVPYGTGYYDDCGICDADPSNDCLCDYFDNCGVCNGDNSDCWYIDIEASVFNEPLTYICVGALGENQEECEEMGGEWTIDLAGFSDEQDLNNRIGMHKAADDGLNIDDDPLYQCGTPNCYIDVPEPPDGQNTEVMFYFPHPEWGNPLGDDFNNYTRDIRELEDLSDFQEIRVWDAVFSTEIMEADIVLSFNFINQETLDGEFGYTRLFVLHDKNSDGQPEYTEVENGDNYSFFHSNINDSLKIIVGAPEIVSNSRVTVVSPNGNEIRSIEENLVVELEYELFEFIGNLKLDLQILECSDAAYTTKETCELVGEEWSAVYSVNVFDGKNRYSHLKSENSHHFLR